MNAVPSVPTSGGASGRRRPRLLFAGLLLGAALLAARPAGAQVLDHVVQNYQAHSAAWLERMLPVAQRTFALLAAIELALSGILWGFRRDSLDGLLAEFVKKFLLLSFLFALITVFPLFVPYVTRGFEWAGQEASGTTAVNPSQVLGLGISIATRILLSTGSLGWFQHPAGNIVASFTALFVLVAFASIAAQLVLVLVETYIVLSGGILFLGFAGFRGTASFADNYLTWSFQVGTKIFLLYLLVGVGTAVSQEWPQMLVEPLLDGSDYTPFFEVLAGSIVFALLVWKIPNTVASHLVQGASFRLQDALRGSA